MCLGMMMFSSFVSAKEWGYSRDEEKATEQLREILNTLCSTDRKNLDAYIPRIEEALERHANVDVNVKHGITLIHYLLWKEGSLRYKTPKAKNAFFKSIIKPILDRYAPDLMTRADVNKYTPLHLAVSTKDKETIEDIVKREPRAKYIRDGTGYAHENGLGYTPLELAEKLNLSNDILDLLRLRRHYKKNNK